VRFSSAEARELLLDPNCEAELSKRLGTKGTEVTCRDNGCLCSAPGGSPAGGLSAVLGFLSLFAGWRLRRSRR
jgi:MYXO-CTERM domain-containing protein